MDATCLHLTSGLEALGLPVDTEKRKQLLGFIKLIEKWNKVYNLTAYNNPLDMVSLHLLDSLVILPYLQGLRVLDIGAGAGLPGIPLAIYAPRKKFILLDSNAKKTRFVQQALIELEIKNIIIVHARVEQFQPEILFDTVVSRAFSGMRELLVVAERLLHSDGILLAMKGKSPEQELAQIDRHSSVVKLQVPGVSAERCLVRIQGGH